MVWLYKLDLNAIKYIEGNLIEKDFEILWFLFSDPLHLYVCNLSKLVVEDSRQKDAHKMHVINDLLWNVNYNEMRFLFQCIGSAFHDWIYTF